MMMLTVPKLYKKHKAECPDSVLSLRAIRNACKGGQLPFVQSGNRTLVAWENFEKFLSGDLGSDGNA
jgi:hypothetical protein